MKVLTLFQLFLKYCDHVSMFGGKVETMLELSFPIYMGPQHFIYTKTHFCATGHIRFLHVCGTQGVQSVDQKVNTC